MTPVPEPGGDIRAQLLATLDPNHPKRCCFMVPADAERLKFEMLPKGAYAAVRDEGTLVSADQELAIAFGNIPAHDFDRGIGMLLGYPELKPDVVEACGDNPAERARAVQARDAEGHVIQEAFTSADGFFETVAAVHKHVPPGGELVILSPVGAIARRIAMRWVEA